MLTDKEIQAITDGFNEGAAKITQDQNKQTPQQSMEAALIEGLKAMQIMSPADRNFNCYTEGDSHQGVIFTTIPYSPAPAAADERLGMTILDSGDVEVHCYISLSTGENVFEFGDEKLYTGTQEEKVAAVLKEVARQATLAGQFSLPPPLPKLNPSFEM